ncbi:hypothetical protein [Rhodococcus wratislaviensis]|nr:hypothetical protein [Rhodococcus wratislaviensis]
MTRYLLDSPLNVRELDVDLRENQLAGQFPSEWAPVATSFLTEVLAGTATVDVV